MAMAEAQAYLIRQYSCENKFKKLMSFINKTVNHTSITFKDDWFIIYHSTTECKAKRLTSTLVRLKEI